MNRFRVLYHPTNRAGVPVTNDGGGEWFKDVDAKSSGAAVKAAKALISHPHVIVETQRLDGVEPEVPKRAPRRRKLSALGLVTAASLLAKD